MGPRRVAKISLFFSLSRSQFLSFSLFGRSSRGILVVFRSAGALKCSRLEFSGCRVKPWRPRSLWSRYLLSSGAISVSVCAERALIHDVLVEARKYKQHCHDNVCYLCACSPSDRASTRHTGSSEGTVAHGKRRFPIVQFSARVAHPCWPS